jgi:hypothetical protein
MRSAAPPDRRSRPHTRRSRRLATVISLLVLPLSLAAGAQPAAAATTLELGRCLKVAGVKEGKKTVYHGAYIDSKCTKHSPTATRKYEWTPGPGADRDYTGSASRVEVIEPGFGETSSEAAVLRCGSSYEGELDSTGLTMKSTWRGCTRDEEFCIGASPGEITECSQEARQCNPDETEECNEWFSCQSEGAAGGEIRGNPERGEFVVVAPGRKPTKPTVGISLSSIFPDFAAANCDNGASITIGIASVSQLTPLDRMTSDFKLDFGPKRKGPFEGHLEVRIDTEEPVELRATE